MSQKIASVLFNLRKYALIYGAGGLGALQALKMDIFSFPPLWGLYLTYFFSMITVACVFLGGGSVVEMFDKVNSTLKKINALDKSEAQKAQKKSIEDPD